MIKKYLKKYFENKQKIKLHLKNGLFYIGVILDIDDDSIIFKDKFNNEIIVSIDSISSIGIVNEGGGGNAN